MSILLTLLACATVLGLRKRHFDLVSFGILATVILCLVVYQHLDALYSPQILE